MAVTASLNSTSSTIASLGSNLTSTYNNNLITSTTLHPLHTAIGIIPLAGKIVLAIMLVVGVVSGILGNILVLLAILLNKILRNQISNIMILNLAITDFLMSAFPMPVLGAYFIFYWPGWIFGDFMCKATAYIANVCGLVSLLTMALIAIDRYFAVMRNRQMLKRRYVKLVLCLFWVISAGALLYPVLSGGLMEEQFKNGAFDVCNRMSGIVISDKAFKKSLTLKLVLGLLVIFSLILMYARMGCFIWGLRRIPTDQDRKSQPVKRAENNKRRALKFMFSIILTFLICWLPYWITTFLLIFPIPKDNPYINPTVVLMTYSLAMLNSSINPVLYALLSRKFRTAYGNVIGRVRGRFSTFRSTSYATYNDTDTRVGRKTTVSEMI